VLIFFSDGRLGNQMFQYAFLRTVAGEGERILCLNMGQLVDMVDLNDPLFHQAGCTGPAGRVVYFLGRQALRLAGRLRFIGRRGQEFEDGRPGPGAFHQRGLLPVSFVETNFFQSEQLFQPGALRWQIKSKHSEQARAIVEGMPAHAQKVFVHVRRGDYLALEYAGSRGIDLERDYYLRSFEELRSRLESPYYIFVSDDPEFVEYCFDGIGPRYISRNDMGVDLALMSMCDAAITSNSSFSWWGAYLMKDRRHVIMPRYWYGWKAKQEYPLGIHPEWATVLDWREGD